MKNKKTLKLLTAFAVTALPVVTLIGTDVSAAEDDTTYADNGLSATSKGTITFTPNTDPVNPVNPDDDDPYTPDDTPVNPSTDDALRIAYVSKLDFGSQKISSEDQTYTANKVTMTNQKTNTTKEINPAVTISDGRGTGAGWKLQVKQSGAFSNGSDTLENATLTLEKSSIYSNKSNAATAPVGGNVSVNTNNATVMTAAASSGYGTWQEEFKASLNVKGNTAKEGTYKTNLVWTLSDTPA
ncbi:WxL domain-containing protein [Listeria ilorinensis]|uniref:WxL domain-containing protein n=1 Tax=Listeria ilorinensis TaxID=2867439 RepID=UPI001EF6A940|nr:WxL domain-containing protein [Listeria ilorinensis]